MWRLSGRGRGPLDNLEAPDHWQTDDLQHFLKSKALPDQNDPSYTKLQLLGGGAQGIVHLVYGREERRLLARKTVDLERRLPASIDGRGVEREFNILSNLCHPNIVRYYNYAFEPGQSARLYMEACPHGSLEDKLNKARELHGIRDSLSSVGLTLSSSIAHISGISSSGSSDRRLPTDTDSTNRLGLDEDVIWQAIYQVSSALVYCHRGWDTRRPETTIPSNWKPVLHRDIKPGNIFVTQMDPIPILKLGDFGLSVAAGEGRMAFSKVGTDLYMAPEISERGRIQWTDWADIFSFGCVLFELCTLSRACSGEFGPDHPIPLIQDSYSSTLRELVRSCVAYSPTERPQATTIFKMAQRMVSSPEVMQKQSQVVGKFAAQCCESNVEKALNTCVLLGNHTACQHLLQWGADPTTTERPGKLGLIGRPSFFDSQSQQGFVTSSVLDDAFEGLVLSVPRRQPALHLAAYFGHTETVRVLLDGGANINQQNDGGETALFVAVMYKSRECVNLLLEREADANLCTNEGVTPLIAACFARQCDVVDQLLRHRADHVSAHVFPQISPLGAACAIGDETILRLLIEKTNLHSSSLTEALCWTCPRDRVAMARMLLRHGADPERQHPELRMSVPELAASYGSWNLIKFFCRECPMPQPTLQRILFSATIQGHVPTVRDLVDCSEHSTINAMIDYQELGTLTMTNNQAMQRYESVIAALGTNVPENHQQSIRHVSPLQSALLVGSTGCFDILLPRSAKEVIDSALVLAIVFSEVTLAKTLLQCGADPTWCRRLGVLYLNIAVGTGSLPILSLLLEHGGDPNFDGHGLFPPPLHLAVGKTDSTPDDMAQLHALIAYKADPNYIFNAKGTPLITAIYQKNILKARILLDAGTNPNIAPQSSISPLALAAGHFMLVLKDWQLAVIFVGLLVAEFRALPDVDVTDDGMTPLMCAAMAEGENVENGLVVARILLDSGADPNRRETGTGRTVLHCAKSEPMCRLLMARGGNPRIRDNEGEFSTAVQMWARDAVRDLELERIRRERIAGMYGPWAASGGGGASWRRFFQ